MKIQHQTDLVSELRKVKAPPDILAWVESRTSLEDVLIACPPTYRIWCIKHGYNQFIQDIAWGTLSAFNARKLVRAGVEPALSMLTGTALVAVILEQPNIFNKLVREYLKIRGTSNDWYTLLLALPAKAKYCPWDRVSQFHKHRLIQTHNELLAYVPELQDKSKKKKDNDKN